MNPNGKPTRLLVVGLRAQPETFLANLFRGLASKGIEIYLNTPEPPKIVAEQSRLHWVPGPPPDKKGILRFLFQLSLAALKKPGRIGKLIRILGRGDLGRRQKLKIAMPALFDYDLVYHPWTAGITIAEALDLPLITSCRGRQVNIVPHVPKLAETADRVRQTLKGADAVHCVSEHIKTNAVALGLDPKKARVIRPAVDPQRFAPAQQKQENPRLVITTTGLINWRKGWEYAVSGLAKARDLGLDFEFHFLGSGPHIQHLQSMLIELELTDRIFLHGRVSPEEVIKRLQESDLFLFTSLSEGISNAVLEAMACELPVICTRCGGMEEAVVHEKNGLLIPTRDAEAVRDAVMALASDPERRHRLAKNARQTILSDFRLEDQITDFYTLIQETKDNSR